MMAAPALTSLVEVCHKRCLKLGMGQLRVIASHQVGKQKPGSNQRLRRATLPETPWPAVMPLCPDLPPSLACKHDGYQVRDSLYDLYGEHPQTHLVTDCTSFCRCIRRTHPSRHI